MARMTTGTADGQLQTFCARLKRLQRAAGISQTALAGYVTLSTSQMSAILNGDIKRLPDWGLVEKVVRACLAHAAQNHKTLPPDLSHREDWRRRYSDLDEDMDAAALRRDTKMAAGRTLETIRQCDAFDLGVHRAVSPLGTASPAPGSEALTPYLLRGHDETLRAELRSAAAGGPSVFAVLTGDSSAGKTRALYESLHAVVPGWPLIRPADADELLELLVAGRFRAGTVLWLNETQRHLYGASGEQAAKRLHRALAGSDGGIAVGALWLRPYLEELTVRGNSPDVHAAARSLLDSPRTRQIGVPGCLTSDEQRELWVLADTNSDQRLAAALASGGPDGDVIQHLTGGPELLRAYTRSENEPYTSGRLFTPTEQALITAALEARRLGHYGPIPAQVLAAAADGYLKPHQRPGHSRWDNAALTALTTGVRPDGSRTDIRRTLTALKPVRARSGHAETGYEPDDYLDQHTRRRRQRFLGQPQLWDALADHTSNPDDLSRLGSSAVDRGLYRHAALLWRAAAATGNSYAASNLVQFVAISDPPGLPDAGLWCATRADLSDARGVAYLLNALRRTGASEAVASLLAREPACHADVRDSRDAAKLLTELSQAGAGQATAVLADRIAAQADFIIAGELLSDLENAGADTAAAAFADHAAARVDLKDTNRVTQLLVDLRRHGASEAVGSLLARDPATHADLRDPYAVAELFTELLQIGASEAAARLLSRIPAAHIDLDNIDHVGELLDALCKAGHTKAVATLADRAAAHADLSKPFVIGRLLKYLRWAGYTEAVAALADRVAAHADLENARGIADLLNGLRGNGANEAIASLLARDPAAHVNLSDPLGVAQLLSTLDTGLTRWQAARLLARDPASQADLENVDGVAWLVKALWSAGDRIAAAALTNRAADAGLNNPGIVAGLLGALVHLGASDAVASLLARDPAAQVDLSDMHAVAELLKKLCFAEAGQAIVVLADRAAAQANLTNSAGIAELLNAMARAGVEREVARLLARNPAAHADLSDIDGVAQLLTELRKAGASEAIAVLADRAAAQADLGSGELARLLAALEKARASQAVAALVGRITALDDVSASGITRLLSSLRWHDANEAINALLDHAAAHADISDERGTGDLLEFLQEAGASNALKCLLTRAADAGRRDAFEKFVETTQEPAAAIRMRCFGREPSGSPAQAWGWRESHVVSLSGREAADAEAAAALNVGLMLANRQDMEGARSAFQLAIFSGHADHAPHAAFNLGILLAEQGDMEGARAAYQRVIDSGHVDHAPHAAFNLGILLAERGDVEGARVAYQRAIDSGHANVAPMAALNLGILLAKREDVEGARAAYQRVIDSGHADVAPMAEFNLGILLAEQGDVEGARAAYQRVIDSGHADLAPTATLNLGILVESQGDLEEARAAYRRAIDSGHAEVAEKGSQRLEELQATVNSERLSSDALMADASQEEPDTSSDSTG